MIAFTNKTQIVLLFIKTFKFNVNYYLNLIEKHTVIHFTHRVLNLSFTLIFICFNNNSSLQILIMILYHISFPDLNFAHYYSRTFFLIEYKFYSIFIPFIHYYYYYLWEDLPYIRILIQYNHNHNKCILITIIIIKIYIYIKRKSRKNYI